MPSSDFSSSLGWSRIGSLAGFPADTRLTEVGEGVWVYKRQEGREPKLAPVFSGRWEGPCPRRTQLVRRVSERGPCPTTGSVFERITLGLSGRRDTELSGVRVTPHGQESPKLPAFGADLKQGAASDSLSTRFAVPESRQSSIPRYRGAASQLNPPSRRQFLYLKPYSSRLSSSNRSISAK